MAHVSDQQKSLMYRLLNGPIDLCKANALTVASVRNRGWVTLTKRTVKVTRLGREAFKIEIARDYKRWKDMLNDTSARKRKYKCKNKRTYEAKP